MIDVTYNAVTTTLPATTEYEVSLNPQSKTAERNGNGRLVRETLPDKWAINMGWDFSTPEEFYDLFAYLKTLTRVDFLVDFPAPDGTTQSVECYISPISAKMINMSRGVSGWWKTLKCTFVEV